MQPFAVVGVGNSLRSDDGAGLRAALLVQEKLPPSQKRLVYLLDSTDLLKLLPIVSQSKLCFLTDAVRMKAPVGQILCFRLDELLKQEQLGFRTTHNLTLPEVFRLGQQMQIPLPETTFYGIVGQNFDHGSRLAPAVEQASHQVAEQILRQLPLEL